MSKPIGLGLLVLALAGLCAPAALPAAPPAPVRPEAAGGDEFFIVSSIDAARQRVVLKRPTEVTVVMLVDERTTFRDEQGRALRLADLHAGATVYVRSARSSSGEPTALAVRLGPMTVEELKRRYVKLPAR